MSHVQATLAALSSARGKDKLQVLRAQRTVSLEEVLRYTYSKEYVYGLKVAVPASYDGCTDLSQEDRNLLDALAQRKLVGNDARVAAQSAIADNTLLAFIINKDLRIGMQAKSVNIALAVEGQKPVIPTFDVQLAKAVPLAKIKFPVYAETKYDGVRVIAQIAGGVVTLRTRNGKRIYLPMLEDALSAAPSGVLDGELVFKAGASCDRTTVSGLVTSAMVTPVVNEDIMFIVFDHLTSEEWEKQACYRGYTARRRSAWAVVMSDVASKYVSLSGATCCKSAAVVSDVYDSHIAAGMEGLILKQPDHCYSFKRSADWAKMKETKTADLVCSGTTEGTGKFAGMIGALECFGAVEGADVVVKVAGLTDEMRGKPESFFKGQLIEVAYNTLSVDKSTGQASLFLPRFKCVRDDK